MSGVQELEDWAKTQIKGADASARREDNMYYIDWKIDDEIVGVICIEKRDKTFYMLSFQLGNDQQQKGVFKSFAAFIPRWARTNGGEKLAVISANAVMQNLIAQCGFKRGEDPDDYFVDISMEDSPPEQYGNSRP